MPQLKLRLDIPSDEALRLLEAIELVATGLAGKRSLWQCLAVAAEAIPELRLLDYPSLVQRSEEQQQRAETVRLQAAKAALTT